jgi:alpha-L-fucosidase
MYDSAYSRWTAARMGPCRDVISELARAVRDEGLTCGLSSHRAEHWFYMHSGREFDSDVQDPVYADLYGPAVPLTGGELGRKNAEPFPDQAFLDDWMARTCELVDRYQPQLVYFDWWIFHPALESSLQRFAAYYYNQGARWGRGVAINYKEDAFPEGTAVFDVERGQSAGMRPQLWQTCTAISNNSWGYVHDQDYKTAVQIIAFLIDIVSKNGTLLLTSARGPTARSRRHKSKSSQGWVTGWQSTEKRSTARGRGASTTKNQLRSLTARSPRPNSRCTRARIFVSRLTVTHSTPSPWRGPVNR